MQFDGAVAMLIFVVVGVVGGIVFNHFAAKRADERRRELESFAGSRGWTYRPADPAFAERWSGPPFHGGSQATDVFTGQIDGWDFTAAGYSYTEGSGDNEVTRRFAVAAVDLPAALPMLWIAPETAATRIASRLGSHDIDFESEEFNQTFVVRADDDRYAHAIVHPRMMDHLLRSPARYHSTRIEGNTVLMWASAGSMEGTRAAMMAQTLVDFAKLIPTFALPLYETSAPRAYAGTVAGVRREPTVAQLWAAGGLAAFGFFFSLVPLAFSALTFTFLLQDPGIGPGNLGHRALFLAAPLIVVAVSLGISGIGLAKLIRGYAAIRRNKRDRERRLGEMR